MAPFSTRSKESLIFFIFLSLIISNAFSHAPFVEPYAVPFVSLFPVIHVFPKFVLKFLMLKRRHNWFKHTQFSHFIFQIYTIFTYM